MAIANVRIPDGLIPAVIDCVLDRIENLTDLSVDPDFPTYERDRFAQEVADLQAVIVELEDPGSVTWKEDEHGRADTQT
jgi:hypothetical protein